MLVSHQYLEYNGAVFQTVYGNGSAQLYHYDNRGFLTSITYGQKAASGEISWDPTPAVTYSYSPEGRLIARSSSATAQSFAYDFLGRVIRSSTTGSGRQNHTIDQTYDPYNRLDSFTETIGQTFRTTKAFYSPTGELTGLSLSGEDSPSVLYEYDELLRLKKRTLPNGRVTEYRYLDAGPNRTTSLVSAVIEDGVALLYSYDARGNILTIKKEQGGSTSLLFEYAYDALGQLIREDDLEMQTRSTYTYDGNGNITGESNQRLPYPNTVSGAPYSQFDWLYEEENWKDLLTGNSARNFSSDELGNITSYYGNQFTWKNGRQLASVNQTTLYTYDADGFLVEKVYTSSNTKTRFYRNGSLITGIEENGVLTRYFYDTSGSILGFEKNGETYYYLKNLQGDVTGITDSNGEILGTYRYDAWGFLYGIQDIRQWPADYNLLYENPFRYRGYYYDTLSGLYYLNSRYYSPELKRFLSADSFVSGSNVPAQGNNAFAYCFNNPVNMRDQTGRWPSWNDVKNGFKEAVSWIDENIIQPVTKFANAIAEDCRNFNPGNTNEQAVFKSNYFSAYKETIVIKTNFQSSFSFGIIGLSREQEEADILNHEFGHCLQLEQKGIGRYVFEVAIPSMIICDLDKKDRLPYEYYSYPWEAEANQLGGASPRSDGRPPTPPGYNPSYWDLISLYF